MFRSTRRMDGKTVLITGANTGIGKETARDLAGRGARLILACRDMKKAAEARDEIAKETGNENIVIYRLDLASFASVRACAQEIIDNEPRVDVLINNAGASQLGNKKSEDGNGLLMQVNYFGPFLLTNLLVDLMKKSAPSRIIFVASVLHKAAKAKLANWGRDAKLSDPAVYSYSKLGNVLNANELSRRLAGTGVTVNSLHPGIVVTDIWRNFPPIIRPITVMLVKILFKDVVQGTQTIICLAVSEDVEDVTGKYFVALKEANTSRAAKSEDLAKRLWALSEEIVKVRPNVTQTPICKRYSGLVPDAYKIC